MSYWLWYMSLFSYKCWKRVLQRTERCKSLLVPAGGEVWLRHIWLQEPHHPPTAHYSAPSTDIWTSLRNGICGFSKLLAPWQTSNDAWSIIMTQWSLAFFFNYYWKWSSGHGQQLLLSVLMLYTGRQCLQCSTRDCVACWQNRWL